MKINDNLILKVVSIPRSRAPYVEIGVSNPINNIIFSLSPKGTIEYISENNLVTFPSDVSTVYYYTRGNEMSKKNLAQYSNEELAPVYQSIAMFAKKRMSALVKEILTSLGDRFLYRKYSECCLNEKLDDFVDMCISMSKHPDMMFAEGKDFELKENPRAFTIIDLLFILSNNKNNLISLKDFNYNKMSRDREAVANIEEEKLQLIESLKVAKTPKDLNDITEKLNELKMKSPLEFKAKDVKGNPILNLNFHKSRANMSVQVKIDGCVNIPENKFNLPDTLDTFIFRNYNIIKDGSLNVDYLPMYLSETTFRILFNQFIVNGEYDSNKVYSINLKDIPIINESMILDVSAEKMFKYMYQEMKLKASEKVLNAYKEKWFGKEVYGYSPKVVSKESDKSYVGVELNTSIKGLSSIPSFNAFMKKVEKLEKEGKDIKSNLTVSESLLCDAYYLCSVVDENKETYGTELVHKLVHKLIKEHKEELNKISKRLVGYRFSIIVGKTWFTDLDDDNTYTFTDNGRELVCKASLDDVVIKV